MPRTRSKRVGRRRSRYIRHRGRKTRVGRRKNRRKRVSRRVMRGGSLLSKPKQLRKIPPGKHQKEDDDWSLGIFGDSKDKTEDDTKPKITYTANKSDSNKQGEEPKIQMHLMLKNYLILLNYLVIKKKKKKKAKMEELAQMKAKQEKKKSQGTFAESIEQDKKSHDKTNKELNKQLSGLRKMVGQTSTSQSSTYGMTYVEPIPNSPGSYKVLDKDGIRKHLI